MTVFDPTLIDLTSESLRSKLYALVRKDVPGKIVPALVDAALDRMAGKLEQFPRELGAELTGNHHSFVSLLRLDLLDEKIYKERAVAWNFWPMTQRERVLPDNFRLEAKMQQLHGFASDKTGSSFRSLYLKPLAEWRITDTQKIREDKIPGDKLNRVAKVLVAKSILLNLPALLSQEHAANLAAINAVVTKPAPAETTTPKSIAAETGLSRVQIRKPGEPEV